MSFCLHELSLIGDKHLKTSVFILGGVRIFLGVLHILLCSICLFHVSAVTQLVGRIRSKFSEMTDEQTESFLWLYLAFGLYYVLSDGNLNILTDKIILKAHSEEREKNSTLDLFVIRCIIKYGPFPASFWIFIFSWIIVYITIDEF